MSNGKISTHIDPEDMFADTRMSFGDHIEDLRVHLWRAIKGFFFACIFGFFIGKQVLVFIAHPVEKQLQVFYDRRVDIVDRDLKEGDSDAQEADKATDFFSVAIPAEQLRHLGESGHDVRPRVS